MHGAPPVQMTCGRDGRSRRSVQAVAAAASVVAVGWLAMQAGLEAGLSVLCTLAAGMAGWVVSSRLAASRPEAWLTWDGLSWLLDGQPGDVVIAIDTDRWMLLRFRAHGSLGARWLPIDLNTCGAPIYLCRAALHAGAGDSGSAGSGAATLDANG